MLRDPHTAFAEAPGRPPGVAVCRPLLHPVLLLTVFSALLLVQCTCSCRPRSARELREASLTEDLHAPDSGRRVAAARELGSLHSRTAVPPLIHALYDIRLDVRLAAVDALGRIGDSRAVSPLCSLLQSQEWQLRRSVAEALRLIGDPKAIDPLVACMVRSTGPAAMAAAGTLSDMGPEAIPPLLALLDHECTNVREAAAYALGHSGDGRAVPALRALLSDPEPRIRLFSADALSALDDTDSASAIAELLTDDSKDVRVGVRDAIAGLGAKSLPALVELSCHEDRSVRTAVLGLLARIGGNEALVPVLQLLRDRDRGIATQANKALEDGIRDGTLIQPLVTALKHSSPDIRIAAIARLEPHAHLVPPNVIEEALADQEAKVRTKALRMLERTQNTNSVERIASCLADPERHVRLAAASALAAMGDSRANLHLLELLDAGRDTLGPPPDGKDREARARYQADRDRLLSAIGGLARTRDTAAVDRLTPLLKHGDRTVSAASAGALGCIGDPEAVPHLIPMLALDPRRNRDAGSPLNAASVALGRIGDARAFTPLLELVEKTTHRWWAPIRAPATEALAKVDPRRAVGPLVRRLESADPLDVDQIRQLSRLLAAAGDPSAIPPLVGLLTSETAKVRSAAADALRRLGSDPAACRLIIREMGEANVAARSAIAGVLGGIGQPAVANLVTALDSGEAAVRQGACWAFGYISSDETVPALVRALADDSMHVRAAAAWALGRIGDGAAVPSLIRLIHDPESKPRLGAVQALALIGDMRAAAPLLALLEDETDPDVRASTQEALVSLRAYANGDAEK